MNCDGVGNGGIVGIGIYSKCVYVSVCVFM